MFSSKQAMQQMQEAAVATIRAIQDEVRRDGIRASQHSNLLTMLGKQQNSIDELVAALTTQATVIDRLAASNEQLAGVLSQLIVDSADGTEELPAEPGAADTMDGTAGGYLGQLPAGASSATLT